MKKRDISVSVDIYESRGEMPEEYRNLVSEATAAAKSAYAPYSGFSVGAAVLMENGEVITGSNQENAAYPSGLCAERVAVFYAKAKYPNVAINQLAIIALKDDEIVDSPAAPCGACRQVLIEYEEQQNSPLRLLLAGKHETLNIDSSSDLLPLSFGSKELG